ncbi:MAG TPA: BamA/TamA family outer membrane protein [Longimicrobiales bacterium]
MALGTGCVKAVLALACIPATLLAQTDSAQVVPGPRYEADRVQEYFLGENWRHLWLTPISAPVLDLGRFAGGLRPFRTGGNQSTTLHMYGADGRRYIFRSVDKFVQKALPPDVRGTPAGILIQDQTSALFPTAELSAGPIQDAVGILYPPVQLYVMPDDPRLGEFRETFAGMPGLIFERPNEGENETPGFAGSRRIVEMERMLERLRGNPEDRVDSREYLAARLVDFLIGDTDRSEDQWRWARFGPEGAYTWRPIALDRDYTFVNADGALIAVAVRPLYPKLVEFGPRYPGLRSLIFSSEDFEQPLLSDLDRRTWDSVTVAVQARVTDDVIERAIARLPAPYRAREGTLLARNLRARRDALREISTEWYERLAEDVDVHGTDESDRLEVTRLADGTVDVRLYTAAPGPFALIDGDGAGRARPYYRRRFLPAETDEVRVYLYAGDDRAVVRGPAASDLIVRVIGGDGDDVLMDSTTATRGETVTAFYDASGENVFVVGPDTRVDRRPFRFDPELPAAAEEEPVVAEDARPAPDEDPAVPDAGDAEDEEPQGQRYGNEEWLEHKTGEDRYRDYGSSLSWRPWVDTEMGVGLVVGAGPVLTRYGFRHVPYRSRLRLTGLFAPGPFDFGVQLDGDWRRENSPFGLSLLARAVQFGAVRFFGFGNDTPDFGTDAATVLQNEVWLAGTVDWRPRDGARLSVGPAFVYRDPRLEAGRTLTVLRPPGTRAFGQFGLIADGELERTDGRVVPRRGFTLDAGAGLWPLVGGDAETFGEVHGVAAYYVPVPGSERMVLALRAGGERVWGDFPVQEAAYIGGRHSLRGYASHRFAGDASLFGSAELRVPLARVTLFTRGELGALAFGDAARVFIDGDSDGGWHSGVGAGLWFATLGQVVSAAIAHGEDTRLYAWLGLPY